MMRLDRPVLEHQTLYLLSWLPYAEATLVARTYAAQVAAEEILKYCDFSKLEVQ